jgi:hypothetical protein
MLIRASYPSTGNYSYQTTTKSKNTYLKLYHHHIKNLLVSQEIINNLSKKSIAISPLINDIIQSMPLVEKTIISAALSQKIENIAAAELETNLVTIITAIYTIAGQQCDEDTLALYASEIKDTLLGNYPALTVEEIKMALKNGVYEKYGPYFGLNPKTFFKFIEKYLFSEERKEAKNKFEQKKLRHTSLIEMTPEERERDNKSFINYLYTQFLNEKLILDYIPSLAYDFLDKTNTIQLSTDQKYIHMEWAKSYINNLIEKELTYNFLLKKVDGLSFQSDTIFRIRLIAKAHAVWKYFEACKADNMSLIF